MKRKYKVFAISLMFTFLFNFYFSMPWVRVPIVKADPLTPSLTLNGAPSEKVQLLLLGFSMMVCGFVFHQYEQAEATGKELKKKIEASGHKIGDVVVDKTIKFTDWYKDMMFQLTKEMPTKYIDANTLATGKLYDCTFDRTQNIYYVTYNFYSNVSLKPNDHIIINILNVTNAISIIGLPSYYKYPNVVSAGGNNVSIDITVPSNTSANWSGIEICANAPVNSGDVYVQKVNGSPVDMTTVIDQGNSIIHTIPADDTFTFNPDADLSGVSGDAVGTVATDTGGILSKDTGILSGIWDFLKSLPKLLGDFWTKLWDILGKLLDGIKAIPGLIVDAISKLIDMVKAIPGAIVGAIQAVLDWLKELLIGDVAVDGLLEGIKSKFKIDKMTKSWDALKDMDTSKGKPPVIKMPMGSIFRAATSRFGLTSNPFSDNEDFVDFNFLDKFSFAGFPIVDYFRMIFGFGFVMTTFYYVYRKIMPKSVMGSE